MGGSGGGTGGLGGGSGGDGGKGGGGDGHVGKEPELAASGAGITPHKAVLPIHSCCTLVRRLMLLGNVPLRLGFRDRSMYVKAVSEPKVAGSWPLSALALNEMDCSDVSEPKLAGREPLSTRSNRVMPTSTPFWQVRPEKEQYEVALPAAAYTQPPLPP